MTKPKPKSKRRGVRPRIRPTRRGRFILTGKVSGDQACRRIDPNYSAPDNFGTRI